MGRPSYNDNEMVVAYYRYSSSSQNEASIDQQREMVHRWASQEGLTVVREYEDAAKTGRSADRPGYQLMLKELPSIQPAYVAVWKNDRLARDRGELLFAREIIRKAGARLHYIEGISPTDSADSILMEAMSDAYAEYYSAQLSANVKRGHRYNAERGLSNGYRVFGYTVGDDKRYKPDPATAPIVTQIFTDYASGVPMQRIADRLNAQGVRTVRGGLFTPKSLGKILKSRRYIGEYRYSDITIADGMPRLVDDVTFERVQKQLAVNRRRVARSKATQQDEAVEYWLTSRLSCGRCGGPMQGTSGTSKTGKTYRYYACLNQRKKACDLKPVPQDELEFQVEQIITTFLDDPEWLASLAVDLADHHARVHGRADAALRALEARRSDVETKLANFVRAIADGLYNASTAAAMASLEEQKAQLEEAIQKERVKSALLEDESSIGAFYERFARVTLDEQKTRDQLFEYFIDQIYVMSSQIVTVTRFYDSVTDFSFEEVTEALENGHEKGELRTYSRSGFDSSPNGGSRGTRTPDPLGVNEML